MKQLILDLKSGDTRLLTVPAPAVQQGQLLVQTSCSVISPGTERMLLHFGRGSWLAKARQQPERVQQVLQKVRTDGLKPALSAVFNKLDQPLPLGYSQCGIVIGVGAGTTGFRVGDRVASNGYHAEVVTVPVHLAARVPDQVPDSHAAFTVLGAIALQSIRLLNPTFGETVAVIGLGLIGQLTVQLLQANGCRVIGFDIAADKLRAAGVPAADSRATDPVAFALAATGGTGVDGVIITASAHEDAIMAQAAQMCRKRGRIVLTGVIDLHLRRSDFYEKELTFQVSCSYGPGRYEPAYEQQGLDYPIGFVRWTEQRNLEAVLQAMAAGQLDVAKLISREVGLDNYSDAYDNMDLQQGATVLRYDAAPKQLQTLHTHTAAAAAGNIGIIGAGSFTTGTLLPGLHRAGAPVKAIASKGGLSAAAAARKFGIGTITTDVAAILEDPAIDTVVITTQHQHHAAMAAAALRQGKHVFVEKPLAIDEAGLQEVIAAYLSAGRLLFVGYNRRFAPLAQKMRELLQDTAGGMNIIMTVNAGSIPATHWLNLPESGGRLIGEVCHFIDLAAYLTGSAVTAVCAQAGPAADSAIVQLQLADHSIAAIHYFTNGSKAYDKERIEVFSDGRTLILENWKKLHGYGFRRFTSKAAGQDKGHDAQFREMVRCIRDGSAQPIAFQSLINTARATLAIGESIRQQAWIKIL